MDTELRYRECVDLLAQARVGRCAFSTPHGPTIVPVNHVVHDDAIIIRTSPYSQLGLLAWGARVAYEVDEIDPLSRSGWSVVATGRCDRIEEQGVREFLHAFHDPDPWARGARTLYLRVRWDQLTGRRIGMTRMDVRSVG
ncbi:pyridoxamine 5'-phosphate oxidase [Nocardioides phosphati]|uniref:Pyridoxamine 5'-phosphate oxidase n=1 Tax=Nocardioides phosphati TaxID=1867775 RepID=A0ABQ2ND62_9ACTN|nr:pyridoxamine 5'-phosphate oxidase family protein [Nocardioides phosphati]GGO92772.1 pyridoxamine 5'-phosphate oxidase [Nocardioides phosphati]